MSLNSRDTTLQSSTTSTSVHGNKPRPLFIHAADSKIDPKRRQSVAIQPNSKSLLAFTTGKHHLVLTSAGILSLASGFVNPALAIFLGKVFDEFSAFGAGNLSAAQLRQDVTNYSIFLAALGIVAWTLNACFFATWLAFGELQAKAAQSCVFTGLAARSITWYDMRKQGIGAMIPRLQT